MATLSASTGGFINASPRLDANGSTALTWGTYTSGPILTQSYETGSGWRTTHELTDLPPAGLSPNTITLTAGDWAVAAWTTAGNAPGVDSLWVKIDGPTGSPAAVQVSSDLPVASGSARLAATSDGGVTVVWVEQNQPSVTTGRLVSRHWSPGTGWSAIAEHEADQHIVPRLLHGLQDGSAMLFYEMEVVPSAQSTYAIWARPVGADGQVGAASRLDAPALGAATGWGVHAVSRGDDVVAAWLQPPSNGTGGFCVVSRTYRDGNWSDAACVNQSAEAKTVFQPRLVAGPGGHVAMAWFGDAVYESRLQASGAWSTPTSAGAPGPAESGHQLFDLAVCRDGSTAVAWRTDAATEHVLSARVLSAAGTLGERVELARLADAVPEALHLGTDDACNWTALWSAHGSSDTVRARRLLAGGALQPTTVIADGIELPWVLVGGYRFFTGTVSLSIEPGGTGVALWNEQDNKIRWRRLE